MSRALARRWPVAAGVLSVLVLIGTTWAGPKKGAAPKKGATITAQLSHFKNNSGQVLIALFRSGNGFPEKFNKAAKRGKTKIKGRKATYKFNNITPGAWAIAVVHDENGNGKMDTNFLGIPKEGYGASRNPRPTVGAPSFKSAKFTVKAGDRAIKIRMVY